MVQDLVSIHSSNSIYLFSSGMLQVVIFYFLYLSEYLRQSGNIWWKKAWKSGVQVQETHRGRCLETQRLIIWPIKTVPLGNRLLLLCRQRRNHILAFIWSTCWWASDGSQAFISAVSQEVSQTTTNKWRNHYPHPSCHSQLLQDQRSQNTISLS